VVNIREVRLAAGAEFVVMVCGDIMTMPGLPKVPVGGEHRRHRRRQDHRAFSSRINALADSIRERGFVFAPGAQLRAALGESAPLADWSAFAASWNDLALDTHLPDGHRYRRRRHGTFSARAGARHFRREAHTPHYQAREYNQLVGGIERWFEPIKPEIATGATFTRVVDFGLELYGSLSPGSAWHIEAHQFRIEARSDTAGQPTPEGVHRDGVDYVTVMLVDRVNIAERHDHHAFARREAAWAASRWYSRATRRCWTTRASCTA
jgi:hypothetical protein